MAHNSEKPGKAGKGAAYTHARRPVKLAYFEQFDTKEEAMRREYRIKQLPRAAKEELIAGLSEEDLQVIDEVNASCPESSPAVMS